MRSVAAVVLGLVILGLVAWFYVERSDSPPPPPASMTANLEVNKQVVRDLYAAIDAQDYDRVRTLWSDDLTGHLIGSDEVIPAEGGIEMMQM